MVRSIAGLHALQPLQRSQAVAIMSKQPKDRGTVPGRKAGKGSGKPQNLKITLQNRKLLSKHYDNRYGKTKGR